MAGHQKLTASGVVGTSGKPVLVFSYSMKAHGSGPGTIILHNGTATSDTETYRSQGVPDQGTTVLFGAAGKFFPDGLYAELDGDVAYIDFDFQQVQA